MCTRGLCTSTPCQYAITALLMLTACSYMQYRVLARTHTLIHAVQSTRVHTHTHTHTHMRKMAGLLLLLYISVLILLPYICSHTTAIYVFSYSYYICVLILLLYMLCVLILRLYMCSHTTSIYVFSYNYYICVLICRQQRDREKESGPRTSVM